MAKNYSDWLSVSQKPQLPPVIALSGSERFFIDEALEVIRKKVLTGALAELNYDVLNAKKTDLNSVFVMANTLPVMSAFRLVEVQEAENMKKEEESVLESYLSKPSPSTVLVFIFDNLDARQKIPKILESHGVLFKMEHPKEDEMLSLIKSRAKHHQLHVNDEIASVLWMEVGTNLLMLERALEKLVLACGAREVTLHDVTEQVAQTRIADAFLLGKAVALGNRKEAAKSLAKLKSAQEVPLQLAGMLAWQLRQVLKTRLLLDRGLSEYDIGKTLHLYGDRLKPVVNAALKWKKEVHINRLSKIAALDKELKSSRAPGWLWLERVVFQLCPTTSGPQKRA